MDKQSLGKRINEARKDRSFTSEALSERCNINAAYLRQIECGNRLPSLPVFVILCNALEVSPSYLLKDMIKWHELRDFEAIAQLWEVATPNRIKLVLAMVRAVISETTG